LRVREREKKEKTAWEKPLPRLYSQINVWKRRIAVKSGPSDILEILILLSLSLGEGGKRKGGGKEKLREHGQLILFFTHR